MRGAAAGRRRPTDKFILPPPIEHRQMGNSRDSDASFASSRPSSVGIGRPSVASDLYTDRSNQSSAIRAINAFLSFHSCPISLRAHPVPSLKDINETLKFLLSALDYPYENNKMDDELIFLLKSLSCPFKMTKSTLRAPNTPHNWPTVLAVIHWMVQLARYNDHLSANPGLSLEGNSMKSYAFESYRHYIRGEDDMVADLDRDFLGKLERERDRVAEMVAASEKQMAELEDKLEGLRKGPSQMEAMEEKKRVLEQDANKFHAIIGEFTARVQEVEKVVEEKENELKAKQEERLRICEENEELKKRVQLQSFNARDAERMKRELQAVERDIAEAEVSRDAWEQKTWETETQIRNNFNQLQTLSMECNQAFKRLKLDIQYAVNEKGSTPTEVMGLDYKSVVKPALESFANGINKGSMERLEELITLQHQSSEMASRIEVKRSRLVSLQSHIDEMEAKLKSVKKEIQDQSDRCEMEMKLMVESVQQEAYNLDAVEKEAAEILKASEQRLEEAVKKSGDEIQASAAELFALIDSVSRHKEYMDSKISELKNAAADTAGAVSDVYKGNLQRMLGSQK